MKFESIFLEGFWNKVDIKNDDECWLWLGATSGRVGQASIYHPILKRAYQAYRISYEIKYGDIENGKHILHSCDNPTCVNPNHLRQGTHQENMKDMFDRNRNKNPPVIKGEKHGMSKLTEEQVLDIKKELSQIKSIYGICSKLSNKYNVSPSTISLIYKGKIWKDNNIIS